MSHYYSVAVYGDNAEAIATELRQTFGGRRADYTGHPFFHVEHHLGIDDFKARVEGMADGHEVAVRKITKAQYSGR